ncbi:hypothetical protein KH5_21620 [Urechidicola sp. KH5]
MIHTNLVILAGGASSRMKKQLQSSGNLSSEEVAQANTRSKGLISIDGSGRPLMDYLLYHAQKAGYKTIYIITGEDNSLFKSFYGEKNSGNIYNGLTIHFATQFIPKDRVKPFGTADALWQAMEQYPELKTKAFTVCNSDNLYSIEALKLMRTSDSNNALVSYDRDGLKYSADRIARFALMQFNQSNELMGIKEKPTVFEVDSYRDSYGKLRVSMNIFSFYGAEFYEFVRDCEVHPKRNEKELPSAIMAMIRSGKGKVEGVPYFGHVPDLTSKDDIIILKEYVATINLSN